LDVWRKDQDIDALNTSLFRELLTYMMEDPRNITFCSHMLFCAKNIERAGDHATNIAETGYYIVEGHQLTEKRPKADVTSKKPLPLAAIEPVAMQRPKCRRGPHRAGSGRLRPRQAARSPRPIRQNLRGESNRRVAAGSDRCRARS
jgi:hypothetical protein